MGILDWIGERLDTPLQGVGINPAGMPDAEKWGMRGRVVSAFGNSIGPGAPSFFGQLDNMAVAYADQQEKQKAEQLQQQMQQQMAQVSQNGGNQADVYRRYAAMFAAQGKPDLAKKYMDIAEALNPREEYSTDPKTFMSASGQPVVAVFSKSGGMRVLDVQPLPDRTYQDTGSYISVRDKVTGRELERLPKTMSPAEAANLRIAAGNLSLNQQRFNREGVETGTNENGDIVTYNKYQPAAGGTVVPGVKPAGADKPTEGQLGAAGYLLRMTKASEILDGPVSNADGTPKLDGQGRPIPLEDKGRPGYLSSGVRAVPFVGDTAANALAGQNSQLYRQAQEDWVRAKLRKESGAVIGDEEMAREIKTYFPQPGDSEGVIAQKRNARRTAEQAMALAAGSAARRATPAANPVVPAAPANPANSVVRVPNRPPLSQIFGGQ